VQRGLPIRLLVRHFEKQDEHWAMNPRIRQMVRWRRINLLADLRPLGQFDVIFCRNVISTLEPTMRRRVLEQMAAALPDDGWLVLGLEETVVGVTEALSPAPGRRGLYRPNPAHRAAAA
jgi:chemotaxis protein methyltransferase CheR